jgi:ABC-type dipeptide/oligopeptide/nickel transport system permease component
MLRYIAQRLLFSIPVFLGVVTVVFFVIRVIPGDPATAALGDYASQESVEALRERMGLNEPLIVQYFTFLGDLVRGDFGESLISGQPIRQQVASVLPYTVELTIAAILIGIVFGLPIGVSAAVNRNGMTDYLGRIFSLAGLSVPAFYFGVLLIYFFAVKYQVLPALGGGELEDWKSNLQHLILPAFTLGLVMVASVARLSRSALLNILSENYIRTARAKGLYERVVLVTHALRAALVPIVSLTGIWAIALIGDSVTTEIVFARPGLGKMMVGAIKQRDYTSLQSIMVIYTLFVVLINLAADLTYGVVDPRIRAE